MLKAFRRGLLAMSVPITKWVGHVHAPWTHKRISGRHYLAAKGILQPGDVLMSRTDGELTNVFIPGFWSHGAVYVGNGEVVEATGDGVHKTDLLSWMLTKDYVRVCRARFATALQRSDAAYFARSYIGLPYDYGFASGNKALYCFEITYVAYRAACGVDSPWTLRTETLGVATVIGDDFDRSRDKWDFVWDSRTAEV